MYSINPLKTLKDKIKQPATAAADIIPRLTSNCLFVGASGSGKSTLLVNLMTRKEFYFGCFDQVFLISPTGRTDDVQKHLDLPDEHIIDDLSEAPDFIENLMDEQREAIEQDGADGAPQICIIYDDVIANRDLMKSTAFTSSFVMSRHFNFTTLLCTQSFTRVPRVCRLQAQNTFLFAPGMSEMELIAEEHAAPGFTKKRMHKLISYAVEEKFSFLHINRRCPFETRYRKNLSDIIVLESVQ